MSTRAARALTVALDYLLVVDLLIILAIVLSGGFTTDFRDLRVTADTTRDFGYAMLGLLLLRKLLAPHSSLAESRPVSLVASIIQTVKNAFPTPTRSHFLALIGSYFAVMSLVTIRRHVTFHSNGYDLGIFDQLIWSVSRGFPLESSILGYHFLGEHFSPILYLLAPLYWVWPDVRMLLIFQTFVLSLGAFPIWWFASKTFGSRHWALVFSALYLTYQPLRNVNVLDFHPIALATPLLLFGFWFLEERKYLAFLLSLLLALLCKEEVAGIAFFLGLYVVFVHRKRLLGYSLGAAGLGLLFFTLFTAIPHFRGAPFAFIARYSHLGNSVLEIATTILTSPLYTVSTLLTEKKIMYLVDVCAPLGFLAFLSPGTILLAAPTFFQNTLASLDAQHSIRFPHVAPMIPFVFVAAIRGVHRALRKA